MWSLVVELVRRNLAKLLLWGLAAGGVAAVLLGVRNAGKQAAKLEELRNILDAVKVKNEIRMGVDSADAVERQRLRAKWRRG